ncbi:unnamed protein product [Adineta ricciae]|uniref:Uncharacterized protein n=1 Tax=Adineta ricciae TaxID=249248 RepID=A0A815UVZ5_ADIRI|nr:unnamed protein product [Adineta ricciae]CAF1522518.1 unnamed protein product [Adineta ricciae]
MINNTNCTLRFAFLGFVVEIFTIIFDFTIHLLLNGSERNHSDSTITALENEIRRLSAVIQDKDDRYKAGLMTNGEFMESALDLVNLRSQQLDLEKLVTERDGRLSYDLFVVVVRI